MREQTRKSTQWQSGRHSRTVSAKQTEKETGENRGKLACIRFLRFFFAQLPRQKRSQ